MGRVLALDYGTTRIGVAISDPSRCIAQPLEVISAYQDPLTRIASLVTEYEVEEVVLGQPLDLKGRAGLATQNMEPFRKALRERLAVPVILLDERLTTAMAERSLIEAGMSRAKRKQNIDKIAASLILQSYLENAAR